MERTKYIGYVVVSFIFMASVLYSQGNYTLKGKLIDENGDPVVDAHVTLMMGTKSHRVTDSDGKFVFSGITTKDVNLEISKIGHVTLRKNISLTESVTSVDIVLSSKVETLEDVTVEDRLFLEKNEVEVSTNRLGIKPIDMPNSSDVVGSELIYQQQAITPSEVMVNVSGVFQFNKGYGGASETFGARGLSLRYLGFMFRDGVRFGTDQYAASAELQAFEKVEVLKGGAAINFGLISPGATINYVTKKPFFETKGFVSFRYGSYNFAKPTVDLNVKLSDKVALRWIGTADVAESFRETVKSRRYYNYLSFRYLASETTTIDLNAEYLKDKRPMDMGIPIFGNRIVTKTETVKENGKDVEKKTYLQDSKDRERLYYGITKNTRGRFLGSPFNDRNSNQVNINLRLDSKLSDNWNLLVVGGTSISDYDYVRTGSGFSNKYELVNAGTQNEDIKIIRTLEKGDAKQTFFGGQANLTGNFSVFSMKNRTSFSIDYDHRYSKSDIYNSISDFDAIYLFNKRKDAEQRKLKDVNMDKNKSKISNTSYEGVGVSFQNLLSITESLKLLGSIRMDAIKGGSKTFYLLDDKGGGWRKSAPKAKGDLDDKSYNDIAFTPAAGVTYKITKNNSIFSSYTNSFNANSRIYLDDNDEALPSYYIDQYEIGTKNSFFKNQLTTNLTYYIINGKSYVSSPSGTPDRYVISPGTKYRGLELDIQARPMRGLYIKANYSYIDALYGEGGYFKAGTRPQQTPMHQLGFWSRYKFNIRALRNFSINFGGQYTGERLGNDFYGKRPNNPYVQKPYTILNAGIAYEHTDFDVNFKITNLLDEFTFFAYRYGSVNPNNPRQFAITARYKF